MPRWTLEIGIVGCLLLAATSPTRAEERQITRGTEYNFALDNNDNFSPDDRFLVYAAGRPGGSADARLIAKVEIATGRITPLYAPENPNEFGPGVLAAGYAHNRNEVIFIHGPLHPTGPENRYEKHCRLGAIAGGDGGGTIKFIDARNVVAPFTVGALRGGTHRHEFSGDGRWVGFTYNDAVVRAHGLKIDKNLDLRTIGVTKVGQPVRVPQNEFFPDRGEGFSALVVVVTAEPRPGSDEISNAAGDSWVGHNGYARADGGKQLARAFIGTTRDKDGKPLDELFIVDIPDDITAPGPLGPLQGTETTFPMPPAGTSQRRLTHTENSPHPGCQGIARSSPKGDLISFRMKDAKGQSQIFVIPPTGGTPKQATSVEGGVTSDARFHPSGRVVACVAGNKLLIVNVQPGAQFGRTTTLSDNPAAPYALVWSHDGKTLAYNRTVKTDGKEIGQIFVADFKEGS